MSTADQAVNGIHPFEWIFVSCVFGSFMFSFGTGSNDVANAFATSVGSGTLTMPQAIMIAATFEFIGAMVLGQTNVNVIAGGIADKKAFDYGMGPYLYAYGMMLVMWVGGIFQLIASTIQLNVSATHAVIGGIMGFAIAHKGSAGVLWAIDNGNNFPPYTGLVPVVISWFFSPVFTATCSFILFNIVRFFVLRSANSVQRSYYVLPFAVFATIWINTFFVCTKGAKSALDKEQWNSGTAAWVAAVVAGAFALASIAAIPFIMKRVEARMQKAEEEDAAALSKEEGGALIEGEPEAPTTLLGKAGALFGWTEAFLTPERKAELMKDNNMDEFDPSKAEAFSRETEFVFNYLQVITAIAVIFAHGANEVGYASGPLATCWDVVLSASKFIDSSDANKKAKLGSKTLPNYWIIFICAFGLVSGLAIYGGRLTWGMAMKLAKLSASRGFCAELCTAIVITVAAQYGMPTSSSQCITGGIIGVGLAEGINGVNWKYFIKTFFAWVLTMFIMGITVGLLYAWGTFAPLEINP